jgi:hypothetical protein
VAPSNAELNKLNLPHQLYLHNLQGGHPVVLAYIFFYCPSEHNNYQELIYITCVNGFIVVQFYYSFRLVEPSSGNTHRQQFIKLLN